MKKAPNKYTLRELHKIANEGTMVGVGGKWYPARPLGYYGLKSRLSIAWLVFTGQADAVTWPEDASQLGDMRRRSQQWHLQARIKRNSENAKRRSLLGVLEKARNRIDNPVEREPKMSPYYPFEFGIREKATGEIAFIDFTSVRNATKKLSELYRYLLWKP